MSQEKRPITAEDLYSAQQVSTPQVSPDGSHVIFAVQRVDRKTEKNTPIFGSLPAMAVLLPASSPTATM